MACILGPSLAGRANLVACMGFTASPRPFHGCLFAASLIAAGTLSGAQAAAETPPPPPPGASTTSAPAPSAAPSPDPPASAPPATQEVAAPPPAAPTGAASAPGAAAERKAESTKDGTSGNKGERPAWYGPAMLVGGAAWFASSYVPYYLTVEARPGSDGLLFVPVVGNVVRGAEGISAVAEGRASFGDGLDTVIAIWAGVGQVVGLVFMTAGAVLTVQSARAPAKGGAAKAAWSLRPGVGPGGGSLLLTGQF